LVMHAPAREALIGELEHYVSRIACMRATLDIVDRLAADGISGDFVECGVLRGGHMLLSKVYIERAGLPSRRYWLFDTFDGMPEPGPLDVKHNGEHASVSKTKKGPDWCRATLDTVRDNFDKHSTLDDSVVFVKGMVETTLNESGRDIPERIAFLRLDTDFYASTKAEMDVLYPRLVPGGILVVDDYGFWRGSKIAIDEYFGFAPEFEMIDFSARMLVKR